MIIFGIDPGTATTGYGVISVNDCVPVVKDFGLIQTNKNGECGERLLTIEKSLSKLLIRFNPDIVVLEKLFFASNAKTAMSVGQAIGVIIYATAKNGYKLNQYAPGTVKKIITGDGRAEKKMIQKSLRLLLGAGVRSRNHQKTHFDNSADALALALCHAIITGNVKIKERG